MSKWAEIRDAASLLGIGCHYAERTLVLFNTSGSSYNCESLFTRLQRYQDRAAFGSRQRLRRPCRGKEVRPMEHDEERSWLRLLITIAIDWRLVIAVILLLLLLLRK
jgi:hypothetical protein